MSEDQHLTVQMGVVAAPRSVSEVREAITRFARRAGWIDEGRIDDLRLLASEIVTNAVTAHRRRNDAHPIGVECSSDRNRFELVVRDHGGGFDAPRQPLAVPDPDPERDSGFGLALISTLADETHFARTDDGTEVRIVLVRRDTPDHNGDQPSA